MWWHTMTFAIFEQLIRKWGNGQTFQFYYFIHSTNFNEERWFSFVLAFEFANFVVVAIVAVIIVIIISELKTDIDVKAHDAHK